MTMNVETYRVLHDVLGKLGVGASPWQKPIAARR